MTRNLGTAIAVAILAMLATGCMHNQVRGDTIQQSLENVVDIVQLAVDKAAQENPWKATEEERAHWAAACKKEKASVTSSCKLVLDASFDQCEEWCGKQGSCSFANQQRCRVLLEAKDYSAYCGAKPVNAALCQYATSCTASRTDAATACKAAESISVPGLKHSVLTLVVERATKASAGVNIIVVSFGASSSEVATNTVQMTLKPRVRDAKYGSVEPPMPPMREARNAIQKHVDIADELAKLITDAVKATVKEMEGGKTVRPPMAMAGLEIEFSLVSDREGNIGIKKAWELPVAGIDLGAKSGEKSTNKLKLVYGREE